MAIHAKEKEVELADGGRVGYDALLLATGATPVPLDVPGADLPHVHYLRTLADSNGIIEAAKGKKRVVVIGASFIGLEVAASLRQRKLEVTVVAPEEVPLERVMGKEVGALVRTIHEEKGVSFVLSAKVASISGTAVHLEGGNDLPADLVVVGIGVKPAIELAEKAGLEDREGCGGRRASGDERSRHLRRRRHRAVARPAHRRENQGGALGPGPAPGPDRGPQHDGQEGKIRRGAVLLDGRTTTSRSTMWGMRRGGTRRRSRGISRRRTAG